MTIFVVNKKKSIPIREIITDKSKPSSVINLLKQVREQIEVLERSNLDVFDYTMSKLISSEDILDPLTLILSNVFETSHVAEKLGGMLIFKPKSEL